METMTFEELQQIVSVCLEEITKLKQENEAMRSSLLEISRRVMDITVNENQMSDRMNQTNDKMTQLYLICLHSIDNIKYEMGDARLDKSKWFYPKFCPIDETIESIVNEHKSLARFGDGEFAIMTNETRHKFQSSDSSLAARLREVIQSNEEGMLIGIADNYGNLEKYSNVVRVGIRDYMTEEVREKHRHFLDEDRIYHDAYLSRPYVLYRDNATDGPKKRFENLKRIWDKRKVLFVEGTLTRLGVGNDLFSNAAQIRRIEAPPVNAFDKYDEILQAVQRYAEKDTLVLIALGPTAGVLAYDLFHAGYQALDIGHLDLEYEWYLKGTGTRCEVKNKYNNECPDGDKVEDIQDEEYERQIVYSVK